MQPCHDCHEEFENWKELAQHIVSQKKTHNRKSRVWALTFLAKKDNVQEFKPRMPMPEPTAFGEEQREKAVRILSGRTEPVKTVCPNCKKVTEQKVEVEYIQDRGWRNSNGTLIVNCQGCRKER